ncbi:MAG: heavy-metal-associated domain-containing protein [Sediminibacterium sp.]|jgi:copper chaperone CopZ
MKLKLFLVACSFVLVGSINAQIKSAEVLASGLTCSMCSKAIFKALSQLDFVDTVKVNIETSVYQLSFKKDSAVKIEGIRDAVYDAGFAIAKLSITADWKDKTAVKDLVFNDLGYQFKWQTKVNKTLSSNQKVVIVNKDIQPINGTYLLNY